jgi:hypothetical protein
MNGPGNGKPVLLPHHLADLRRSGLSDEEIAACGFRSTKDPEEVRAILGWKKYQGQLGACLVIPYRNAEGAVTGYIRLKPDRPFARKGKGGRAPKYESPIGQGNHTYFGPGFSAALADPECPLLLTEGEKKAARADQEGFGCIGLPGVWSWAQKTEKDGYSKPRDGRKLIADLEAIDWRRRRAFLVYDSDAATNDNVVWAEYYLAAELERRGAVVKVVRLPGEGDKKVGLDDYLLSHPREGLQALMEAAKEARPPAPPAAAAQAQAKPRPLPPSLPYHPFPLCCLPPPLDEFVRQGALALGADPASLALPVLATVAGAIGNSRVIRIKRGWLEPCVVWAAVVGESGTLKSPAWHLAVRPLHHKQKILYDEHKTALDKFFDDMASYEEDRKKKKPLTRAKPKKPAPLRHLLVSDSTIEKMAEILEDCPRGTFLARDELAAWLTSFQRYKGKAGGSDLHNWLEAFHGRMWKIDRKTGTRTTLVIPRPAVSVAGGVTPGVLRQVLSQEYLDAGLAARLLFAMPPAPAKKWRDLELEPEIEKAYEELLDQLLGLEGELADKGDRVPLAVGLSREAREVWIEFYDRWGLEQSAVEGELAAAYSKLEAYAARLSLVCHVVSRELQGGPRLEEVGPESVQAGCALCWWFANETRRIYSMLSESPAERQARRLVEMIRARGGRITVKELQNSNSRKWRTADEAESALEELAKAGMGEWQERPAGPRGGRPSRWFVIKAPDDTDETSFLGEEDDEPEGGAEEGVATKPPTKPPEGPKNPMFPEVSSVSSVVGNENGRSPSPPQGEGEVSSGAHPTKPPTKPPPERVSSEERQPGLFGDADPGRGVYGSGL